MPPKSTKAPADPVALLPFRIFISYTNEDSALASAIHRCLTNAFLQADLRVDLMKEFRPGTEWRAEIDDSLSNADLLLLVYTGQLKPSHSWTGYEVGFFSSEIKKRRTRFPDVPREIVPINFLRAREATTEIIEGIEFSAAEVTRPDITLSQLAENSDRFLASITQGQQGDAGDQLFRLLQKIADSVEICTHRPTRDKEREQRDGRIQGEVTKLYKELHSILRHRPKDDTGLQNKIIVSLTSEDSAALEKADFNATIEFQNQAQDVFHLSDSFVSNHEGKRMTWADFQAAVLARNESQLASLWLANLKELVRTTSTSQFVDNDLLIPSWDQSKTYRAVVTRRVRFFSGRVDIHIYLFELFKREDYGDRRTSIYLNAVAIACRYRSLFLEPKSQFSPQWMKPYRGNKLRNQVMKMLRELDLIHQDSVRTGLNSAEGLAEIYGIEGVELLSQSSGDWVEAERLLREKAALLIQGNDEAAINAAKPEFEQQLVRFCKTTNEVNVDYLNRSLKKLEKRNGELMATLIDIIKGWESDPARKGS